MNDPHILYYLPHRTKKGASALKHKNNAVLAANRIKIIEKMREAAISVLPIVVIVLLLCLTIAPVGNDLLLCFLIGTIFVIAGMGMFSLGAEASMTPIGNRIGTALTKTRNLPLILIVSFLLGFAVTIAEPDLQVLAGNVPEIDTKVLILTVSVGVGFFLMLCMVRILFGISLRLLLIVFYVLVFLAAFLSDQGILAVAFDSGGVTTGPITVPFIMALGVGMAAVRGDKNAASDSFGLVALSSIGPILAVLLLGCFFNPQNAAYTPTVVPEVATTKDVALTFAGGLPHYMTEVAMSILPIVAVFFIFQMMTHRYQKRQRRRVMVGFAYTYAGLVLFLCGVNVGFGPVGTVLGRSLAQPGYKWLLVPIGMLIGFFIVKAEPAIQVLNRQIQSVTSGAISARAMNRCLSIGVSVSVGLAMLRVVTGIPVAYILLPGYVLALGLSFVVPPIFVGIAFDSGGVASGPMTTTFLLPLSIGACETLGGNVMTDAFGVVALVALTPLIAVQLMGVAYRIKMSRVEKRVVPAFDGRDEIVELEEEWA